MDAPTFGRSVSLDRAAQTLAVSRRTIYNMIRDGRLTTIPCNGSQRVTLSSLALCHPRRRHQPCPAEALAPIESPA